MLDDRYVTDLPLIIDTIQSLAIAGQDLIDTKMAKHIKGPIYELRKDRHRIFYSQDGIKFVLLSAFYKYTQKTPQKEIRRAQDNYLEYQEIGDFFALKLPPL